MKLEWTSEFETGNEAVDLQHRYFFNLIKRIENAYKGTTDQDYRRELIIELKQYAVFHFTSEVNIATSLSLPGVSSHHERHSQLLEEFSLQSMKLENGTLSFENFFQFLIEWLIGHTLYEDKLLFNYQS